MAQAPHWILVPIGLAACALMLSVAGGKDGGRGNAPPAGTPKIALRIGELRTEPLPDPRALPGTMKLCFPPQWAGRTIDLTVQRADGAMVDGRSDWVLRPTVASDGSVKVAGWPSGRYRMRAEAIDASLRTALHGEVELDGASACIVVPMVDTASPLPPR